MARAADQFRSSDVTFWGIVALVCGGLAVLSANVSAVLPQNLLAGLHVSRLEGTTLNQLRAQVAALQGEAARLSRENATLASRFTLAEQQSGAMARRIGAVEVSLPNLLEQQSALVTGDITASIGTNGQPYPTEGGAVSVQHRPLEPGTADTPQTMPPLAVPATTTAAPGATGVALGPAVPAENAAATWNDIEAKIGMLLLGLGPVLADAEDGSGKRVVAGPLRDTADAAALCRRVSRVGIACAPVPYAGTPLTR